MILDAYASIDDYQQSQKNISENTPRLVSAVDAEQGQAYYCCYCGARLFRRTSDKGVSYYVCFGGEKHSHPICIRKEKASTTYAVNSPEFSVVLFFNHLFDSESETESSKTREKATAIIKFEKDAEDSENSSQDSFRVLPYSSIKQLIDDDIKIRGRNAVIDYDRNKLVDLIVFGEWLKDVWPSFSGGKRIFECIPNYCDLGRWYLQFRCYLKNPPIGASNYYYLNLYFGQKEKQFNRFASLLFSNETNDSGSTRPKNKYRTVFVAGDWETDNINNYWAGTKHETFRADFVSSRQIYAPKTNLL
jgi:hypothetical protein